MSNDAMEKLADQYAMQVLTGEAAIPGPSPRVHINFRELANEAAAVARDTSVDAGAIIFSWARATGNYSIAVRATQALYLATGATRILRQYFNRFVDVEGASLSDQELMRVIVPELPVSPDATLS